MTSERPSIHDVATAAGVSPATVSRVLTGARSVRPESAEVVLAAVARLGYRPNQLGRALRKQSSQVIGMIVPSVDNPFFPLVIQVAERRLRERGYALLLSTSGDDPDVEAERVEMLVDRQVDGLLISPCHRSTSASAVLDASKRVPLVQIDRAVDGVDCDFVGVNDQEGIRLVVAHAALLHRRRVAYIGGDDRSWSGRERHTAFARLAKRWRSSFTHAIRLGEFSEDWGRAAAEDLFALSDPPDAVICGNDLIAVGVIEVCERLGIYVPDEVVVSGYDDIGLARMCRPPLTTVRQPINDLTERAIDLLLTRARDRDRPSKQLLLQTELVVRQSMPAAEVSARTSQLRAPSR